MYNLRVFTNGCFDLLHDGHKYILDRCMYIAQDGYLLVGINTDSSIRNLKGDTRPIQSLMDRANYVRIYLESVKAIRNIDVEFRVVSFDTEDDLMDVINSFSPDMIVKGNDITDVTKVTGSKKWPVLIVPRIIGFNGEPISTTKMIERRDFHVQQ